MKIQISKKLPRLIEPERYGLNGRVPNPRALQRLAQAANHLAARRGKLLFCTASQLHDVDAGLNGVITKWMWKIRTSASCKSITFFVGMAAGATLIGQKPQCYFRLNDGTADIKTTRLYYGRFDTTPSNQVDLASISHLRVEATVAADTEYHVELGLEDHARVVYAMAYETPAEVRNTGDMIVDPSPYLAQAPIYDVGALIRQVNALRKTAAQPVFSWCPITSASSNAVSSTSPTNIFDGTTGGFNGTEAGFRFSLRHRGDRAGNVNLAVWANGQRFPTATDGIIQITFTGGGFVKGQVTLHVGLPTSVPEDSWVGDTVTVPDTVDYAAIRASCDPGTSSALASAVSVYQYG